MPASQNAAAALDALGDGNRRAILRLLADGERPVVAIAEALPVSRPAVSRHLRLLREAGLVSVREEGTRRFYRLDPDGPAAVEAFVRELWGGALARFAMYAENTAPEGAEEAP